MSNRSVNQLSEPFREEDELVSLRAFLRVINRWSWVVLMVLVLFLGMAVVLSLMQTPQYAASINVLIGQKRGAEPVYTPSLPNLEQLTLTMAEAVDSRRIAVPVVREWDLEMRPDYLLANLSAEPVTGTQFIEVTYVDTNPDRARQVINAVGSTFSKEVSEIGPSTNYAAVWESAANATPVGPGLLQRIGLALVLGAIVGTGLAFVLEALDDSWQSPEELEQISGVPTFGVVPTYRL
jgi:capsular polysaccharide biosynthesis protein